MTSVSNIHFYKHKVGDGSHYVNDHFQIYEGGGYQLGDPSDTCIILNAQRLCEARGLPGIWVLWTLSYPEDPMDEADAADIFASALPYTEDADPLMADNLFDMINDLRSIGCAELADLLVERLAEQSAT